jgi:two-component system, NarL family, response regulator LiaR
MRSIKVALLNDYEVVVAGLASMLNPYSAEIDVVDLSIGEATPDERVDVALYDSYGRPGLDLERIAETVRQDNVHHVAVFTFDFHARLVSDALECGVTGYLWKGLTSVQLVDALQRIAAGEVVVSAPRPHTHPLDAPELAWPLRHRGLTARESEAVALLVTGLRNREIAAAMYVSIDTVKTHLRNIYRKLGVRNRAEVVAKALADPDFARRRDDADRLPETAPS